MAYSIINILAACLVALTCVYACLTDRAELDRLRARRQARTTSRSRHRKRDDAVEFPPVLTEAESVLVNSFDSNSIADWSLYYTSGFRLAGQNRSQAEWTQQQWTSFGWESWIEEYWIWYTEPSESSLTLHRADGTTHAAQLFEDPLEIDVQTADVAQRPAYHALSASGHVTAEYVYVGYVDLANGQGGEIY
jgi:N-acetylated-alpha-linked acidic dipeptidase